MVFRTPADAWRKPQNPIQSYDNSMQTYHAYNNARTRDIFVRSQADRYAYNPLLRDLIAQREAREDYKRKFGSLPMPPR